MSLLLEKSDFGSHRIEGHDVLLCAETGRVVAVFYNDYDLDAVINNQSRIAELEDQLSINQGIIKNLGDKNLMLNGECDRLRDAIYSG